MVRECGPAGSVGARTHLGNLEDCVVVVGVDDNPHRITSLVEEGKISFQKFSHGHDVAVSLLEHHAVQALHHISVPARNAIHFI